MQPKFRHEDHNRQDKAKKPDYREDLIEDGKSKADPTHLKKFKKWLQSSKEICELKDKLISNYHDGVFFADGRQFQFRWSFKEYIKQNEIREHFSQVHRGHHKIAAEDLKNIEVAIRKAPAIWDISDKGKQILKVLFYPRIKSDRITPLSVDDEVEAKTLFKNPC